LADRAKPALRIAAANMTLSCCRISELPGGLEHDSFKWKPVKAAVMI
jgi:hypothetical protein